MAVLLGDNGVLLIDGAMPLEPGTVVPLAPEGRTVTVVVSMPKAVPEMVPSM